METNQERIEERKGIIVIGMISSGKSTFLNSLLGITYLEANDNITTKLVVIIRYNEELKEPKFYHLKILQEGFENGYYFIKDGEESIGEEKIIQKISEINKKEAQLSENGEPEYSSLFYMLETNIKNIENKEFLKSHDFYDIPGLNEFMRSNNENNKIDIKKEEKVDMENKEYLEDNEEEEKNDDEKNDDEKNDDEKNNYAKESNEDMRYIKGIFKYLKNIIERKIIVLSSENYYKPQNLQILQEIKNYLNIPLKDNLIILNKIDISNNRKYTISDCKQFYVNNIDSTIFNINNNTFVPLNSMQFQNELLMKEDYKYYYLYYLNLYKEKYVNITEDESKLIKKIPFIEFLVNQITIGKKKEEKMTYLEELASEFKEENFEIIKNIYEEAKKKTNMIIDYGIDFDDEYDDSVIYMKAFYENFEKKTNFPNYSEDVLSILNYFNNFKDKSENLETAPLAQKTEEGPETKAIKMLKNIFQKLKKYVNKNDEDNIINDLSSNLDIMEKFILNDRKIYIPFIGVSSAGKTTIINCIVGYKLFPEALNECTTRGIIIEYSPDIVELYEMQIDSDKNYYVFNEKNKVAEGYKEVREYLESLNARYGNNENKYFYKVKTTIKSFDDFGFDDELKKRILMIDLPGPDTKNNKFNKLINNQRTSYEKLLIISSSFIYINKGRAIKSIENQKILKQLYTNIQDTSSLSGIDYLKACLFVINIFGNLSENELELNTINEDLSTILFDPKDKIFEISKKEIKSTIFNAKNFYDFLKESVLLQDHESLFEEYKKEFLNQDELSVFKKDNFPRYCLQKLKSKLKDLGFSNINTMKCTDEFLNKIKNIFTGIMNALNLELKINDNKIISDIANMLFPYLNEETIKDNMNAYKNAYSEGFLENLKNQIIFSKIYKDEDYIKKLKGILKYFDTFFKSNIKKPVSTTFEKLQAKKKEFSKGLENIFKGFNTDNFFNEAKESIEVEIKKNKNLIKHYMNEKKEADEILNIVKNETKVHFDLLEEKINNKINNFNKEIEKFIQQIKEITEIYNQTEDLKNNEQYINSFNDLLLSNKHFFFNKEENNDSFISKILSIFYSIKYFFKKKNDENVIKEKIDELKLDLLNNLNRKKRLFNLKLEDQRIKIKANFKSILCLSFSDLSNIEEKEWKECKKIYYEAKGYLLSNEKEENDEECEKDEENEKKDEENEKSEENEKENNNKIEDKEKDKDGENDKERKEEEKEKNNK